MPHGNHPREGGPRSGMAATPSWSYLSSRLSPRTVPRLELDDKLQQAFGSTITIERELGGGGMSRVFLAVDNALKRRVGVKVLPAEMSGQVSVDRFKREIAIAARLQQAHLVPLLSAGEVDGLPFFVMPFVD